MLGIGGYVDLIFSSRDQAFVVGFEPRVKSSIRKSDADNSQLELDFPIAIESGGGYDLSGLSKRLEGNEAFSLALEIALKKTEPESIATDELTIELKKAFEQIDQTTSEVAEPELKSRQKNSGKPFWKRKRSHILTLKFRVGR